MLQYTIIYSMTKQEPEKKGKLIFKKEIKHLALFLLAGGILILFNPERAGWRFPMGFSYEWRERARLLGWILLIGGYPFSLLIRLAAFLIRRGFPSNK